jgi:putative hemolysin
MKIFAIKNQYLPNASIANCLALIICIAGIYGCATASDKVINKQDSKVGIANPASTNCINKGGTLNIQKGGSGGEYGICIFEDNRQCEEWALFRGECPIGGKKITGYVTPAAQFCVITGGSYNITDQTNTEKEQGICTFNNGKSCGVWDYYNGKCSKNKE